MAYDPLQSVRRSCEDVMNRAIDVSIDSDHLQKLANELAPNSSFNPPLWKDFEYHFFDESDENATIQYIFLMDTLNFCFWPAPTLEYCHLAGGLKAALLRDRHAFDAERLAAATAEDVKTWIRDDIPEAEERARLVRETGSVLLARFGGLAANVVRAAKQSARDLVTLITDNFPGFRDSSVYRGRQVFFYKRVQIFVGDVWGAFQGRGIGQFNDVTSLTMFPDYRVPQVLEQRGVLKYSEKLKARVYCKEELCAGSTEECEIRAATVVAVDRLASLISKATNRTDITSVQIDWMLWNIGEDNLDTMPPHHRTRTIFY